MPYLTLQLGLGDFNKCSQTLVLTRKLAQVYVLKCEFSINSVLNSSIKSYRAWSL